MKKSMIIVLVLFFIQNIYTQTWIQTLNGISMWSLCKDINGKIYAGSSGTIKAIYKSTNNGTSWDTVLSNAAANVLSIACDSLNDVFAANLTNGLLKSINGGSNWTTIPSSTFNNKSVQSVICGRNGFVYVGTVTGGIFRSTDAGETFPDNTLNTLTIVSLAIDRFNSGIIYAGASSGSPPNYGFYRSTDAGNTWSANLNPYNIWGIVQDGNGNLFTVTTSTPYNFDKSTNGGLNWTTVSTLPGAMRGLCFAGSSVFYVSGNGGVFRTTNNGVIFNNWNLTYSSNQIINSGIKTLVAVSGTTNGGIWIFTEPLGIQQIGNNIPDKFKLHQNYPNPFNPATKIRFEIPLLVSDVMRNGAGEVMTRLIIYDIRGREVGELLREKLEPGTFEVDWNASNYPSGVYFYTLTSGNLKEAKKMILTK